MWFKCIVKRHTRTCILRWFWWLMTVYSIIGEYIIHKNCYSCENKKKNRWNYSCYLILAFWQFHSEIRNRTHAQHLRMNVYIMHTFFSSQFFLFEMAYGYQWLFNRWYTGSEISMCERVPLSFCQICFLFDYTFITNTHSKWGWNYKKERKNIQK